MTNTTEGSATVALTERNFSQIVAATPLHSWTSGRLVRAVPGRRRCFEEIAPPRPGARRVRERGRGPTLAQRHGVRPSRRSFSSGRPGVDTMVGAPPS
jgi:hypothetical protein